MEHASIGRVKSRAIAHRLGIGLEKLDRNLYDPEKAYDRLRDLGVKWVRIQSGWARTEAEAGVYRFEWLDAIVDALLSRALTPWMCLCYGNPAYTPEATKVFGAVGCPPVRTARERDAWSAYVRETARHFKGRVPLYEIWNEPDGVWCWKHGVNAEEYGAFALRTARALREGDPSAKIAGGALCGSDLPFLRRAMDAGMSRAIDALSFHRYAPNEAFAEGDFYALRALINEYNPEIRLIQGESGAQSSSLGAGAMAGGAWNEEKQAKHLLRQRITDLSLPVWFASHFSALDMAEALNGSVDNRQSYKD